MEPAKPWIWDASYNEYRYYDDARRCWVFRDGRELYPDSNLPQAQFAQGQTTQQQEQQEQQDPRYVPPAHDPTSGFSTAEADQRGRPFIRHGYTSYPYQGSLEAQFSTLHVGPPGPSAASGYGHEVADVNAYGHHPGGPRPPPRGSVKGIFIPPTKDNNYIALNMQRGEPGKIDPELLKHGIKSKRKLIGTEGIREKLDPEFEKRYPGRDFFKFGKVLKVLWPEPLGDENAKVTIITDSFGERYATKIRWFVVIREGNDSCSCLPIQTYSRKGVAKPTVKKNDHAIIYTGKKCPVPTRDEKPSQGEKGMRPYAIRVEPRDPSYSMDPLSRINFGKVYTLEHNVKVYDFGKVHKDSRVALKQQFLDVWVDKPSDDDGDEEDDDDDNGRANEYQLPDLPQASGSAYASLHDNRGHYERQRSDTPRISSAGYDSPESGYNQPLAPYGYEKSAALARGNHPYTASRSKSMLYAQHQAAAYQTEGGCAQSIQSNQPPGDEEDEEEEDDYEDTQEGGSHYNVRQ